MAEDKGKRFVADDGVSSVPEPVTPIGGESDKKKGKPEEKMDKVTPAPGDKQAPVKEATDVVEEELATKVGQIAKKVTSGGKNRLGKVVKFDKDTVTIKWDDGKTSQYDNDELDYTGSKDKPWVVYESLDEEVIEVEESIQQIIEGMDLSEEFKNRISVVFEAAVNESVKARVQKIEEELNEKLETDLAEAVEEKVSDLVENLDSYLDYIVGQWMQENEVAIEAGIKVEMAESFMDGLKNLFTEHNVDIDDEAFDVISDMENSIQRMENESNEIVNENIELKQQIAALKCERAFDEATSDLTVTQRERLRTLSETLDTSDLDEYTENLQTIKESFFAEKTSVSTSGDVIDEEDEIITEEQEVKKVVSDYSSINALVEALNARK